MLRPWWQAPWFLVGGGVGAVAVMVLIIVLIVSAVAPAAIKLGPVPASVLSAVTDPPPAWSARWVAAERRRPARGQPPGDLVRIDPPRLLTNSAGKPEIVFVGAEYCPYCAAERWPIVMAL